MEGFAKSDDEKDFYLDRIEGFLVYVDLDKSQEEIDALFKEIHDHREKYVLIPKLTYYEIKKVMEQFVNEKVYDIDTKEKLLDIIQSREARENFLEFIYDHHSELEKWQQFYQERFRIRIIEWLRNNSFDFVFEEDIELAKAIVEKVKINMFIPKVPKDVMQARKLLAAKASTYYSSEALNPRPKRGRPPKQVIKVEAEPQFAQDIYVSVPKSIKPFLFTPDYDSSTMIFTFSGKFSSEEDLLAHRRQQLETNLDLNTLSQKLAALKSLSANWQREQSETQSFSEALVAGAVETQATKAVETQATKAVETKATKAVETKATKAVETKATKAVETKATKAVETKATKAVETKAAKAVETKATKAVETKEKKPPAKKTDRLPPPKPQKTKAKPKPKPKPKLKPKPAPKKIAAKPKKKARKR
jgi:hypothetical protein